MSQGVALINCLPQPAWPPTFSHAYLFFGEPGVDVFEVAFEAVKLMICDNEKCMAAKNVKSLNYSDLIIVSPEKNLISKMDIVSTIKNMTNTSLVEGNKKILIIENIDSGNKSSLNSLLKYLEDPSDNTHIIMTTNKIDLLLSTIKSRAQNILVKRKTTDEIINDLKANDLPEIYIRLFANIFPNFKKGREVNIAQFEVTYNLVLNALTLGVSNYEKMKLEFNNIISKDNIIHVTNILEYFYFQLQTSIDEIYPLFPDYELLIKKYKTKNINYSSILQEISIFKRAVLGKGNFNLQKENFLLRMIKIYEG